jgi:hypothetical protein
MTGHQEIATFLIMLANGVNLAPEEAESQRVVAIDWLAKIANGEVVLTPAPQPEPGERKPVLKLVD